jgi:hypothetical protein
MRVVREQQLNGIKVTIFDWNNKYLLKFENGLLEQTFKVPKADVLQESDLDGFFKGDFFERVVLRFKEMGQSLQKQVENL